MKNWFLFDLLIPKFGSKPILANIAAIHKMLHYRRSPGGHSLWLIRSRFSDASDYFRLIVDISNILNNVRTVVVEFGQVTVTSMPVRPFRFARQVSPPYTNFKSPISETHWFRGVMWSGMKSYYDICLNDNWAKHKLSYIKETILLYHQFTAQKNIELAQKLWNL